MNTKKRKHTKIEQSSLQSGLQVGNAIKVSYHKNNLVSNIIVMLCIALMGLFGTIFSFITIFNIDVKIGSIMLYTSAFFILFAIISILPDKFLFSIFPILLLFLYIFKDYTNEFVLGFKIVSNKVSELIYSTGIWTDYYNIPSDIAQNEYATLFLIFCIFLLTGLICLFTIKVHSCVMGFLLTFPFIECGIYFGAVPNYIAFFMVVCYWLALLSMALSGCKKSTKNKSAGFVRVGNSFFAKTDCNFKVSEKIGISTVIICLICALISTSIVYISGYERSDKINTLRNDIKHNVENFSFEDISTDWLNKLLSGNNGKFNGNLGQKDSIKFEEVDTLQLTLNEKPQNSIYLKGYVGTTYTGNSWNELDKSAYNHETFKNFKEEYLYPQDLPVNYWNGASNQYTINIKNLNKGLKTALVPYYAVSENNNYIYDTTLSADYNKTYSFKVVDVEPNVQEFNVYDEHINSGTNFDNSTYRDFINKYYLTIEDNTAMDNVKNTFSQYLKDSYNLDFDTFKEKSSNYTKLTYIRDFLCSQYDYTLSPGKTPLGEDFVDYFLNSNKKGYCGHFASAGTILCRMLDIPARYIEGYIYDGQITNDNFDGTNYNVFVKDSSGHAWTEIYIDNLGWLKFDFTPGFNGNPTKADFQKDNTSQNDTPNTPESSQTQPNESQAFPVTETNVDVTTTPNQTQQDDTSEDTTTTTEPQTQTPIFDENTLRTIKHILIIIISIGLLILFIILRRNYIIKNRLEKISNTDSKTSILESYKYIISLLKYEGFKHNDTTPYMEFSNEVSSKLGYAKNFNDIMNIVLKSEMSNLEISNEEKTLVNSFAMEISKTIYESKSDINKLFMKYILCLI